MERNEIINTLNSGERIASIYADTFLNNSYCDYEKPDSDEREIVEAENENVLSEDEWRSPSDLLIGILDLSPPFTSKITRGKTHKGILEIGEDLLNKERVRFLRYVKKLLNENEGVWSHILEHEKTVVAKKVKEKYKEILNQKSAKLIEEINNFYECSLQDLENHMRKEIAEVLITAHANIIKDANVEIKEKLQKERNILEDILQKRYESEVKKIKHYYQLILDNENYRNNKLLNQALHKRNDAVKAFCKQIEAENITSTMYMMCTERKKCRIKQFILDNYHNLEITEKLKKLKERQEVIDAFKEREKHITDINKEWEEKIKKILQLFLKFISYTLQLLPEQSTFLLDLEKMFVLQLNEIQKAPSKTSILVDEDTIANFEFHEAEKKEVVCDKEPFVIVGDMTESIPTPYGSRETLPSKVELPSVRIQRQFIYAKCNKFQEVKALLEEQRCKCRDVIQDTTTPPDSDKSPPPPADLGTTIESESSNEVLLMDDIEILQDCPGRRCQNWAKRFQFPYLNSYLDFTDKKYDIVKTVLGKPRKYDAAPELINLRDIVWQELPFSATREKYHNIGTQYSSEEDLSVLDATCTCQDEVASRLKVNKITTASFNEEVDNVIQKRRRSLQRVMHNNPKLLKMFTDESFDFVYNITLDHTL
ncbi:unnamed protein product [Arctia plantaginis]|uniref:Uncharacterized protein n=1 Tax=Arctia plantaginis TaxID=874455 RepID=A0A8S0Z098_ARCPL|nr:unnamed protein product [Arctia plantaginis]